MAEKVLRLLVGLFVGIWVARYLGPEKFGLISYAQSFVALFAAFSTLGLDSIVVRELVRNENKRDILLGTAFRLKLIGAFAVLAILAVAVNFTSNDRFTNVLVFIIASATIFQSFNIIDFYYQAKVLSKYAVHANVISLAISSLIKIGLIVTEAPLIAFAWVVLFDSFVLACGYLYFYFHNHLSVNTWRFDILQAKMYLKESYPLMISFFTVSVSLTIDQVILKEMLDARSLGLYVASLRLIEIWYFIPVVLTQSFFPSLINPESNTDYNLKIKALGSFLLLISISIGLFLLLLSRPLILLLFGNSYAESSNILNIHAAAITFIFFASLRKKLLVLKGKTFYIMNYSIATAVTMIASSYFFIKHLGLIGAPIAHLFTWATTIIVIPVLLGRFHSEVLLFIHSFNLNNLTHYYSSIQQPDKKNAHPQ